MDFAADWEAQEQSRHRRLMEQLKQELRAEKVRLPPQIPQPAVALKPEPSTASLPEQSVQLQQSSKRRITYQEC